MNPADAIDSPEFDLARECLRWPQNTADGNRIQSLAQRPIRWPYLLEILDHHKVVPLVSRNLEHFAANYLPEDAAAALRTRSVANAHTCLRRTAHLLSLHRLFREQQLDLRIFKGIPLAIAAYQDPTLRDAGDIDLLVAKKDIFLAEAILRAEGYRRFEPQARLTPRRLRSYLAHQKDFSYEHPGDAIVIDLHWRLFRNPCLPANAGIEHVGEAWIDLGTINLGTERLPTLPLPTLLLYLCVHGALDGWLRLKWLADIGALLHTMTPDQLASAAGLAAKQQALPQFSAAILLCQDLLGPHPMPEGCLDRRHPAVVHILRFAKRLLTSNRYRPIREQIASPRWFLNEFRQHNSLHYRLDLIQRSLFRPRVWQRFDLPDSLFPLYALISPAEWVSFRLRPRIARLWAAAPSARRTSFTDIALAIEAGCMLAFFRIALNFLPVQKLTAWMSRPPKAQPATEQDAAQTLRRIQWSIDTVIRHVPLTFVCFPQSLAAYFMLRRRHIASKLFYGVTRDAHQLKAHTWVKVGDRTIVGGDLESHFTVLATFP